jgi:hypothetical protein
MSPDLEMHVRSVHSDLWFRCEHCNFKASQKVISKHTYKFNTKEWYITGVTNVVIKHPKNKTLKNTCRKMYMMGLDMHVVNAAIK